MDGANNDWAPPKVDPALLILGDMPGDKIKIDESHISRANAAFPLLLERLADAPDESGNIGKEARRLVVSVYGGSGVGKSEIGSILAYYCRDAGYPAYLLSGDNYPHRCPPDNDGERLNRFRAAGLSAAARHGNYVDPWNDDIRRTWPEMDDANPNLATDHQGFAVYQKAGRRALEDYLGGPDEIDFDLVNSIVGSFKAGAERIALKRMGRSPEDIYFESIDFSSTQVLIVEWTHGNNPKLRGVDLPIFLYSSPAETLEHRRSRGRDANTDSAFVQLVLEIEQSRLNAQASSAALILAKDGRVLSSDQFLEAD